MGRRKEPLIFLDTHIVVWLAIGELERLSPKAYRAISSNTLVVCAFARLELQYLKDIHRIKVGPEYMIPYLREEIGLCESDISLKSIVDESIKISWTRDVFDRMIAAEAQAFNAPLVTADKNIRKHYKKAVW